MEITKVMRLVEDTLFYCDDNNIGVCADPIEYLFGVRPQKIWITVSNKKTKNSYKCRVVRGCIWVYGINVQPVTRLMYNEASDYLKKHFSKYFWVSVEYEY